MIFMVTDRPGWIDGMKVCSISYMEIDVAVVLVGLYCTCLRRTVTMRCSPCPNSRDKMPNIPQPLKTTKEQS